MTDGQQDAFWIQRFQNYADANPGFSYSIPNVQPDPLQPIAPPLSIMGQYRLIVWDNLGTGYDGQPALLTAATLKPLLRSYLGAGGKLWLDGKITVPPCLDSTNNSTVTIDYPITDETLHPGTFAYDILKHLWQEYYKVYSKPHRTSQPALAEVEALGAALKAGEVREAVETLVHIIAPVMPHLAEECWETLGGADLVAERPASLPLQALSPARFG